MAKTAKILNFTRTGAGAHLNPGTTDTDLYVVPAATKAYIKTINAVNTNAAAKKLTIQLKLLAADTVTYTTIPLAINQILSPSTDNSINPWTWSGDVIALQAGDKIIGSQESAATDIKVLIIGVEEA